MASRRRGKTPHTLPGFCAWSGPAVVVIIGRETGCLRGSLRHLLEAGTGQESLTISNAITCQAFPYKNLQTTYSRQRPRVMPGESGFAPAKVFTPVADIQTKYCPRSIRLVFAIYRVRVATVVMPLALSRCRFQRSAFKCA